MKPAIVLLLGIAALMIGSCSSNQHNDASVTPGGAEEASAGEPLSRDILFAYFTGEGAGGMRYALGDGVRFAPLREGRPFMTSRLGAGLVRDPSIVRGPDGKWHAVWTTGWWAYGFGVAHSDDLVNWSAHDWAPVMEPIKGTVNTWAPEIHWDPEREEYLVLWSSTVRGMFPETANSSEPGPDRVPLNHRIWCSTTKDFQTWSPARVFFDPGFNVIDATIVRDEPRRRWVLVCKDETLRPTVKKELRLAFADRMQGEYAVAPSPILEAGRWVEGPTILPPSEEGGEPGATWLVLFDRYREGAYGGVETSDWTTFRAVPNVRLPRGARHGCVVRLPSGVEVE